MGESKNGEVPKSFRVGKGAVSVLVYPWSHPSGRVMWRFRKLGSKSDITRAKKEKARQAAVEHLAEVQWGGDELSSLEPSRRVLLARVMRELRGEGELLEFLGWLEAKRSGAGVGVLVEEYLAAKVAAKGRGTLHLRQVGLDLRHLVEFLGAETSMAEVRTSNLLAWQAVRGSGTKASRMNFLRAAAVGLWNWAAKQGYLSRDLVAEASRVPRVASEGVEVRIASIHEAVVVLREVGEEFRLWAVLGLFAGLRPEEISPGTARGKVGLCRSAISLEDGGIYVSREVSKTNRARFVPFSSGMAEWLAWAGWRDGERGPVSRRNVAGSRETKRLGEVLDLTFARDEGWPADWLRHTYGSNRNAVVRSLAQVAEEMGTSVDMMHAHYHQPRPKESGEAFFALRPDDLEDESRVISGKFVG